MATQKTAASTKETAPDMAPVKKIVPSSILTIDADSEIETPESREDIVWHEFQNAYRTKKVLTGTLGGIEKMDQGGMIAVIYYKEMRVVIPMAEMMINLIEDEKHNYGELVQRQSKVLGNMLGCEIDFLVKGLDTASRSVVASRKEAADLLYVGQLRKFPRVRGSHRPGQGDCRGRKGGPRGDLRCRMLHPCQGSFLGLAG